MFTSVYAASERADLRRVEPHRTALAGSRVVHDVHGVEEHRQERKSSAVQPPRQPLPEKGSSCELATLET